MLLNGLSIKCRNFKCFPDAPQGFDRIKPINVIIGRNNSGKTTLLDLIEYATRPTGVSHRGHRGNAPVVELSWPLSADFLEKTLEDTRQQLEQNGMRWEFGMREWALQRIKDKRAYFELAHNNHLVFVGVPDFNSDHFQKGATLRCIGNRIVHNAKNPFWDLVFRRIVADRDIVPEGSGESLFIHNNGRGVTNVIQRYIADRTLNRDIVEKELLGELNSIFRPDANYSRILVQQQGLGNWELYLDEPNKGRIPMSETGSGLKTILLVLANLLLVPLIAEKKDPIANYIFCFEELENNLHPAIQRRLFRYLREFAVKHRCHFFITTHSSVVIDLFSADDEAQIIHVAHNGQAATAMTVQSSAHGWAVLDDLDIRASDVLQTNVVVWVEGPSDRHYFSKWIELWSDKELIEGVHFQCLPFGGSCNAHLSFDSPEAVEELIAAMKISRHPILLADSDRREDGRALKIHTKRLADEVEKVGGYAWITAGREIENYIPVAVYQAIFSKPALRGPGQYADAREYFANQSGKAKPPKPAMAKEILPHLKREDLAATLDLSQRLNAVCEFIRKWNRLEARAPKGIGEETGA